ncbi:MAG: aldolase/citrate lyase family protein, partial [Pseudomonadota bacterium]
MVQAAPYRSVLYMPGSNPRALEKAQSLPADALILDLEDAVAPTEKESARALVCTEDRVRSYGLRQVLIRINALDTSWGAEDLIASGEAAPDGILIPKVNTAADIQSVATALDSVPERTRLWAMMETPLSILNAQDIAQAHPRLAGFVLGTND